MLAALYAGNVVWGQETNAPFIMKTGKEYYITAASPNGKWACGVYQDYNSSNYSFLWNLETNEIEMLDPSSTSYANGVSNDGVVAGSLGYWKDHKWNNLELPDGTYGSVGIESISPDGHYMTGIISAGTRKTRAFIWKDGKILRELQGMNGLAMPYAVAPDGTTATGWVFDENRLPVLWETDGRLTPLGNEESPFTSGINYSPDGKLLLFYGGWNDSGEDGKETGINAILNLETREKTALFPPYRTDMYFTAISNKGSVVGNADGRGCIWQNGNVSFADDYLISRGIDLDAEGVFKTDELGNHYQMPNAVTISEDDNIMGFRYYHSDGQAVDGTTPVNIYSMIVKFGAQPSRGLAPLSVKAEQKSGTSSVLVSWKPNVLADDITGYNIYRDGQKLNASPVTTDVYADSDVPMGDHKYTVTAMYDSEESPKSDEVAVKVKEAELQTPNGVFAQQHSYNNAYLSWTEPYSNYGSLTYYDKSASHVETFGYGGANLSIEVAIKFDEPMLAVYKGKKIRAVDFTPLEKQGGWTINFYTHDNMGKLKSLYSQPVTQDLAIGKRNTVKLDIPLDIPTTGDLLIATEVKMTEPSGNVFSYQNGCGKNGYTDILRMKTEADFYSFGDGMEQRNYMYRQTWDIEAIVASADDDLTQDNVASYNIYDGDKLLTNSKDMKYEAKNLEAGVHNFGISAVYANGKESAKAVAALEITPDDSQLAAVNEVFYNSNGNNSMTFRWNPVKSSDKAKLQYCIDEPSKVQGVISPEGYSELQCSALYDKNMFKGRDGYEIRSFRFYPTGDATYTAYIQQDDETVQEFEIDDYNLYEWNEYTLPTPVKVNNNSSYRLIIDCYDFGTGVSCIGIDDQTNRYGYSDACRLSDSGSWTSISESLVYGNWMMGMGIVNPDGDSMAATGYDVNIDNVKRNNEPLTTTSFDYTFASADSRSHAITVDAYYPVKAESVKGGITRFMMGTAGIEENVIQTVSIQKGDNELFVKGDNVNGVEIYSAAGAKVASDEGNTVSLNSMTADSYIVKANVAGKTITRKIMIKK